MPPADDPFSASRDTLVILDHLSGYHRGTRDTLMADDVKIGSSADVDIHFPAAKVPTVAPIHAHLYKADNGFHIRASENTTVLVNDKAINDTHLFTGDLIQLGDDGPLLRFRLYQEAKRSYKSVREAVTDCIDCAKKESKNPIGRTIALLRGIPAQMPQLSPLTRVIMLGLMGAYQGSLQAEKAGMSIRNASTGYGSRLAFKCL